MAPIELEVVIFGGGASGLWLLDTLHRSGYRAVLLEAGALGSGQTVASQGMIHGGVKYALAWPGRASARAIRSMPAHWARCLDGRQQPDLSATSRRADCCHLWGTETVRSRLGLFGARRLLRVVPVGLARPERPAVLTACPGQVYRVDEQVIDPVSLIETLAVRHGPRLMKIDAEHGLDFEMAGSGQVRQVLLTPPDGGRPLVLRPARILLAAGAGNEILRRRMGLNRQAMQRRPLHMVVVRGRLSPLNGHCIDGGQTRVTVTTSTSDGQLLWQVGGQVSEDGVHMEPAELIRHAHQQLCAALPGLNLNDTQWTTYRVDRAEGVMPSRRRPEDVIVRCEGNVMTAWPTKLVLVPRLVSRVEGLLKDAGAHPAGPVVSEALVAGWPLPAPARPPWETESQWTSAG